MSAPSEVGINVFLICLLVPVMTYALVKQIWNQPLQNGPGFFLGIEVPAGFYEGQGRRWMTGYHAMVAALYGVWAVALAAIAVSRRWDMTPIWAGGFALLFVLGDGWLPALDAAQAGGEPASAAGGPGAHDTAVQRLYLVADGGASYGAGCAELVSAAAPHRLAYRLAQSAEDERLERSAAGWVGRRWAWFRAKWWLSG